MYKEKSEIIVYLRYESETINLITVLVSLYIIFVTKILQSLVNIELNDKFSSLNLRIINTVTDGKGILPSLSPAPCS